MKVFKEFKGVFEIDKAFYETFKECCSKDETRFYLNYVFFDCSSNEQVFVATDGMKAIYHKVESNRFNDSLEGFYELAKIGKTYKLIPKEITGQFPKWRQFFLVNHEDYYLWEYRKQRGDSSKATLSGNYDKDSHLLGKLILSIGRPINLNFLTKVLKHVDEFQTMIHLEDTNNPVVFVIDPSTRYLVKPMKLELED